MSNRCRGDSCEFLRENAAIAVLRDAQSDIEGSKHTGYAWKIWDRVIKVIIVRHCESAESDCPDQYCPGAEWVLRALAAGQFDKYIDQRFEELERGE